MSTEVMNNTDAFYTLTGKPGEIYNVDKVRISVSFTPRTKSSTKPMHIPFLSWVFGVCERLQRTSFLIPSLSDTFLCRKKQRAAWGLGARG
jgi:hypothetical protein